MIHKERERERGHQFDIYFLPFTGWTWHRMYSNSVNAHEKRFSENIACPSSRMRESGQLKRSNLCTANDEWIDSVLPLILLPHLLTRASGTCLLSLSTLAVPSPLLCLSFPLSLPFQWVAAWRGGHASGWKLWRWKHYLIQKYTAKYHDASLYHEVIEKRETNWLH